MPRNAHIIKDYHEHVGKGKKDVKFDMLEARVRSLSGTQNKDKFNNPTCCLVTPYLQMYS